MGRLWVLIPSYDRDEILQCTIREVERAIRPDCVQVLCQTRGHALGPGRARRMLIDAVMPEVDDDDRILMLDDDLRGGHPDDLGDRIRKAAWMVSERHGIGSLARSRRLLPVTARRATAHYHPIILHPAAVRDGLTYGDDWIDDVCIGLRAYLDGYCPVRLSGCPIWKHVSRRGQVASFGGGIEGAVSDGCARECPSLARWAARGWISYDQDPDGYPVDAMRIRLTAAGRARHRQRRRERWSDA